MSHRTILILSHAFNMDGRAASQTITDKIPFFIARGFRVRVLSAVTGTKDTAFDHQQVLPWGAAGLRFDLRHMLRIQIGKGLRYRLLMLFLSVCLLPLIVLERLLLGLQSQWSWAIPATIRGLFAVRRLRPAFVYSTGGAYSAHLAAYWLKRLTGVPWIAEIHDPMVTPGRSPGTRDQKFVANLEKWICAEADRVWWFTEGALASARKRNPNLGNRGFMVLPGANPPPVKSSYQRRDKLVFAHFGSLDRTRSLTPFIMALRSWLDARPDAAAKVQVAVYGAAIDSLSATMIDELAMGEIVRCYGRLERCETTGRSGREQVMARMQEADCLLLMHGMIPECAEYIPSKLYEYFWAVRPVFALTHCNRQLDELVRQHGGFAVPTDEKALIVEAIDKVFGLWESGRLDATKVGQPLGVEQAVDRILFECVSAGLIEEPK